MACDKRAELLKAATSFCDAFASQKPPEEIVSHFASTDDVVAFEHGLPQLAPFLGREFKGQQGIRKYFDTIASCLSYESMSFRNYLIDTVTHQVSVRGEAHFIWMSTKQGWDEVFTYILKFDEDCKVKSYEIWADTGAAYLASQRQLNSVK